MGLSYREVQEILNIIEESTASEVRIEYGDLKLEIRRANGQAHSAASPALPAASPPAPAASAPREEMRPAEGAAAAGAVVERPGWTAVTAPMVGVFYRAPSPGAPPFVQEGQTVDETTELCIIEVMKVMNIVKAPARGRIAEICVENEAMVQFGQVLFWISPASR